MSWIMSSRLILGWQSKSGSPIWQGGGGGGWDSTQDITWYPYTLEEEEKIKKGKIFTYDGLDIFEKRGTFPF